MSEERKVELPFKPDGEREGPSTSVRHSCQGCRYLETRYFSVQDDSGFDKWCWVDGTRKSLGKPYTWDTPDWCLLLPRPNPDIDRAIEVVKGYASELRDRLKHERKGGYRQDLRSGIYALESVSNRLRALPKPSPDTGLVEALGSIRERAKGCIEVNKLSKYRSYRENRAENVKLSSKVKIAQTICNIEQEATKALAAHQKEENTP